MKNLFLYLFILFFCFTALSAIPVKQRNIYVNNHDLVSVKMDVEDEKIKQEIEDELKSLEYEMVLAKYQTEEIKQKFLKNCCVGVVEDKVVKLQNLSISTDSMSLKAEQIQIKLQRIQKLLEIQNERKHRTYTSGISH